MFNNKKVHPKEKIYLFKKSYHMKYFCMKKIFLLLKKKIVVYPLAFFILAINITGYVYSVNGSIKTLERFHPAITTLELVSDFFLAASITIMALYIPKNSNSFYDFFLRLYPEGNKLLGPLLAMKKSHFCRNFFICNISIGTLIALNASFFLINFGWAWYQFIIFSDIQFYFYNLVLLLLIALARKLELRFSELNELLQYKTEQFFKNNTEPKNEEVPENRLNLILQSEHFYSVRTFRVMHNDLCNLVRQYNDMFGRIILSTVVFSISNILAKVTSIIYFSITPKRDEDERIWAFYVGIVCFWIFSNTVQTFLFSYYGEHITKEGEKTTRMCFHLLNKVPFHPKSDDEKLVQEELKLLAFQSYSNIPSLSAGGFFNINYKVLGMMISSVTSYLMVIIQFLLRQPST